MCAGLCMFVFMCEALFWTSSACWTCSKDLSVSHSAHCLFERKAHGVILTEGIPSLFLGCLPHDPETLKDKQKKCVCFKSFSKLYLMSVFPWLVCDMRSQSNSPWHFNFQQIKRPYHSFLDVIRWYDVIWLASTHCLHSKYQCLH